MNTTTTGTGAGALIVLALSSPAFLALLGAIFVYFRRLVDARVGAIHTTQAIEVTGEAVRAAEQIGKTHGLDAPAKYREATDRAAAFLAAHGIALGADEMQTLIEGAVTQIKQANAAGAMPGVVLTGENPTVNAAPLAPPVPVGPTPEQVIAAITTALAAVYPVAPPPDPAPVAVVAPVEAVPVEAVPVLAPSPPSGPHAEGGTPPR